MTIKRDDELRDIVLRILLAAGADERNAKVVAEHLVLANLSGVDTHGIWHVPGYVDAIRNGFIVPTAWPEVIKQTANSALVSGNWTFGQVTARHAMELAIEKAKAAEMAVVGLVQSHHIGRLGHYPEMAAEAGMISMVWAGGFGEEAPSEVPYGGRELLLHTNPIAMGFPSGDEPTMMFDYATSALSGVKVENANRRNEPLPPGCIVDKDGNPTTNASDFFAGGGHVPFGAHKGYALMLAAEFLGRIFCGSDAYADPRRGGPILRHQGVSMIVIKADIFEPLSEYKRLADSMQQRIRAVPPAPGFKEVLVPGDPEARTREARQRNGIPIENAIWEKIVDTAASVGINDV